MKLSEFLATPENAHTKEGNLRVKCNSLDKTRTSFNCNLTPDQATDLAQFPLAKAQIIRTKGIEDAAVQLWNVGKEQETLYLGLTPARKGPRKKTGK